MKNALRKFPAHNSHLNKVNNMSQEVNDNWIHKRGTIQHNGATFEVESNFFFHAFIVDSALENKRDATCIVQVCAADMFQFE